MYIVFLRWLKKQHFRKVLASVICYEIYTNKLRYFVQSKFLGDFIFWRFFVRSIRLSWYVLSIYNILFLLFRDLLLLLFIKKKCSEKILHQILTGTDLIPANFGVILYLSYVQTIDRPTNIGGSTNSIYKQHANNKYGIVHTVGKKPFFWLYSLFQLSANLLQYKK